MSFQERKTNVRDSKTLQEDILLLEKLCRLDTSRQSSTDFQSAQDILISELKALGLDVRELFSYNHCAKALIVAETALEQPHLEVTLISHIDTVLAPRDLIYDHNQIKGSGVADNKGGIVCALRFLKTIGPIPGVKFRFVCSPSEEKGSLGFHDFFKRWGQTSDFVFGFEPALKGSLIEKRNGNRWYQVKVLGIGSHAGRMNEVCVNAAHEACQKISKINDYVYSVKGLMANVAQLEGGGDAFNRTCDQVSFKLDTRFSCQNLRDKLHFELDKIFSHSTQVCSITKQVSRCFYSIEDDCPSMGKNEKSDVWTNEILKSLKRFENKPISAAHSGGAADINYFSTPDNYCLDGLGPVGSGLHTVDERIEVSSLETRPKALASFFREWICDKHTQGVEHERTINSVEGLAF